MSFKGDILEEYSKGMKTEKTGWITEVCQRKVSRVHWSIYSLQSGIFNKLIESEIGGQNNFTLKIESNFIRLKGEIVWRLHTWTAISTTS